MKKKIIAALIAIVVIVLGVVLYLMNRFEYNDEGVVGNTPGNLYNEGLFCETDEYVYFANPYDDYHLYKMTHDGKNAEMLCGDVTSYINVYNDYIYYKRFNYNSSVEVVFKVTLYVIFRLKDGDSKPEELHTGIVDGISLLGNSLYYRSFEDNRIFKLAIVGVDGKDDKIISQKDYNPVASFDGKFYFAETDGNHNLMVMDPKNNSVSTYKTGNFYMPIVTEKYIYYIDLDNSRKLSRINKKTNEIEVLTDDKCINYNVNEEYNVIFYQAENSVEDHKIAKMAVDGSNQVDIISGDYRNISITKEYTYFIGTIGEDDLLYRVSTSGISIAEIFRPEIVD